MDKVYKIKRNLKLPLLIGAMLSIPVFIDVILQGHETSVMIMAVILMILFYMLTINNLLRRVQISENAVTFRGILGIKKMPVEEITFMDGVNMGSKQFISLTSSKKNHLIPNSFDNFKDIITDLEGIIPNEKIGQGIVEIKNNIITRKSDITSAWTVVVVLIIIILIRVST